MPHCLFVFSTDDEPTLLELLSFDTKRGETIDIIDEVGAKNLKFGILLLKDKTGAHMAALVKKNREDCKSINLDIVRQWLQGRGAKPVSWRTLTRILKAVKLTVLAQDIVETIQLEDLEIANTSKHITSAKKVHENRVELVKPTSLEYYLNERTDISSDQRSELNVMLQKVTDSKLSEVCSEYLLQTFSGHMQSLKTLAPFLGMQDFHYDEFTARYPERNEQNYELLLFWKGREGSRATYHHLLETVVLHGTAREMKALIEIPLTGMHT